MRKIVFTELLIKWLYNLLETKYGEEYDIEVLEPRSNLSKISTNKMKKINNYSSFEFKPNILGILTHKTTEDLKLVLLNRLTRSISLRDIGEIYCYSRLVKPELALLSSTKGIPEELNLLLLKSEMERKILFYESNKSIILFRWDEAINSMDKFSVFPIEKRDMFENG